MFNPCPLTVKEICDAYDISAVQLRSALEKNHVREIVLEQVYFEEQTLKQEA